MNIYYSNDFRGHWPVGTSAVIVARDLNEAYVLMAKELLSRGLGKDKHDFIVKELRTAEAGVIVLQDGDY